MINRLLSFIAPHYCYGCAKIGTSLCQNCKYDIADEATDTCIVCALPARLGICKTCRTAYDQAWCVGERSATLEKIINAYKFDRVISASESLASLLDTHLPVLPKNVVIIPVPTIARHIRQRGYDHTLLVARQLGEIRSLPVESLLWRRESSMQRGRNKKDRFIQAKTAFTCSSLLDSSVTYLLLDDVVTTNATLQHAAATLRSAGATTVWAAVIARQPLDKVV